jgi:phosphopantothenoylcysteine decarboxylase/phosphopantothenate--cysteine ligase
MGGDSNSVHIVTAQGIESWDHLPKDAVAARIIEKVANALPPDAD